jgi:hypothetical protein
VAVRTYIPGLKLVLKTFLRYTSKWVSQLEDNLTSEQYTCLQSAIQAAQDCLVLLPDETPEA